MKAKDASRQDVQEMKDRVQNRESIPKVGQTESWTGEDDMDLWVNVLNRSAPLGVETEKRRAAAQAKMEQDARKLEEAHYQEKAVGIAVGVLIFIASCVGIAAGILIATIMGAIL